MVQPEPVAVHVELESPIHAHVPSVDPAAPAAKEPAHAPDHAGPFLVEMAALHVADLNATGRHTVLGAGDHARVTATAGRQLLVGPFQVPAHVAHGRHGLDHVTEDGLEAVGVSHRHVVGANDRDRLELLAAHYGAKAALPGHRRAAGMDRRDAGEVLARDANRQGLGALAILGLDHLLDDEGIPAPEVIGREQADPVAVDQQPHRRVAGAGDNHRVIAGALQLVAPACADVGAGEPGVGRALRAEGADGGAPRVGRSRAGQCARHEHQRVPGIKAVDGFGILIP